MKKKIIIYEDVFYPYYGLTDNCGISDEEAEVDVEWYKHYKQVASEFFTCHMELERLYEEAKKRVLSSIFKRG